MLYITQKCLIITTLSLKKYIFSLSCNFSNLITLDHTWIKVQEILAWKICIRVEHNRVNDDLHISSKWLCGEEYLPVNKDSFFEAPEVILCIVCLAGFHYYYTSIYSFPLCCVNVLSYSCNCNNYYYYHHQCTTIICN